jgi:hypothetical protein
MTFTEWMGFPIRLLLWLLFLPLQLMFASIVSVFLPAGGGMVEWWSDQKYFLFHGIKEDSEYSGW